MARINPDSRGLAIAFWTVLVVLVLFYPLGWLEHKGRAVVALWRQL